jgi:hypothetical protein
LSIAGISLPLQIKRIISGTPISAIIQKREAYCRYKSQNRFPAEMQENYQLWILIGFPLSVICSGRPIELDKPVFAIYRASSLKIKNKNISGSMRKENLSIDITFKPC